MTSTVKLYYCTNLNSSMENILAAAQNDSDNRFCIFLPYDSNSYLAGEISFASICQMQRNGFTISFLKDAFRKECRDDYIIINDYPETSEVFSINEYVNELVNKMITMSMETVIDTIVNMNTSPVTAANIPQFSNLNDGTYCLLNILKKAGNFGPTFNDLGKYLTGQGKNEVAYRKYGENHAKLAAQMDLTWIATDKRSNEVFLTLLGKEIIKLDKQDFDKMVSKLSVRIPIIRDIIGAAFRGKVDIDIMMSRYLSKSTVLRRKPNIRTLLRLIEDHCERTLSHIFSNII